MKTKFLMILVSLFLPLSLFAQNNDDNTDMAEIPLHIVIDGSQGNDNRSLIQLPVECCYLGMMDSIVTTVFTDLGDVALTVTNTSTGSVWYDTFDSALEPQTLLTLSGEPGIYEIVYITESGGVYEGTFTIQ